jgi:hypothetical protein
MSWAANLSFLRRSVEDQGVRAVAIAPSKLGRFVLGKGDAELLSSLRQAGLVVGSARDDDLIRVFEKARREHLSLPEGTRSFNSPNERVRVFLEPFLSDKGRRWAVPLSSLDLPDD